MNVYQIKEYVKQDNIEGQKIPECIGGLGERKKFKKEKNKKKKKKDVHMYQQQSA